MRLHDARTLRRLRDLPGIERRQVNAVEFSPDGRAIAVTGESGVVEVRDVATGRRLRPPLPGLGAPAVTLAFSPDGDRLAATDLEGNLRVIDLETGEVRRPPRLSGFSAHLSFSPDGETLAIVAEREIELRDSRSLRVIARLPNRAGDDDSWVRFSPDGRLLAVASFAGYTQLWDVASRERVGAPLAGHELEVLNAEFSPDGRLLATSGVDGTVILWDVESRRALGTLPGAIGAVSARFTPDGRRLFVLRRLGCGGALGGQPGRLVASTRVASPDAS